MKRLSNPLAALRRRSDEASLGVTHCTWDPKGPGVIRLQLVPPRPGRGPRAHLLHINGFHILPLSRGSAALLRTFMIELSASAVPGEEVSPEQMAGILDRTTARMHALYPSVPQAHFVSDLGQMQDLIGRIARGEETPELAGRAMSLEQYAPHLRAPLRMDLAVMPMRIDGKWACPLECSICYASSGAAMAVSKEALLGTAQWKRVLDLLWAAGVPTVSFTGGDPLARPDIAELVAHAERFVVRLNTSAVLLTPKLAASLRSSNLDVMQVTLYSDDADIHDALVGRKGAWLKTARGIGTARAAGIEVSINTPLVPENLATYAGTIEWAFRALGVRYFTASGMLPAGGAVERIEAGGEAPGDALYAALAEGKAKANALGAELDFTSPGCLSEERLRGLGMNVPACGACLGNMAVGPDGEVLPCQSWVHEQGPLGNILTVPWPKIWDSPACKRIRAAASLRNDCPLRAEAIR